MSLPYLLTSLTEREAVTDAVYRAIEGFDRNNISIFDSAFSGPDVVFDVNGSVINGTDTIRTGILAKVGPMDTTVGNLCEHYIFLFRTDLRATPKSFLPKQC